MFPRKQPEFSQRDFEFLQEKYDIIKDELRAYTRLQEAQERAHRTEITALKEQMEVVLARIQALDNWFQMAAPSLGMGTPSTDLETVYEGFEDTENPGFDFDDFSLEHSLSMIGEVSMPRTENAEPEEGGDGHASATG